MRGRPDPERATLQPLATARTGHGVPPFTYISIKEKNGGLGTRGRGRGGALRAFFRLRIFCADVISLVYCGFCYGSDF